MPKDRRARSTSSECHSRLSPYPCNSHHKHLNSSSSSQSPTETSVMPEDIREWEEARCPICMEHPHNAVRLLCASSEKGCHAFMCDTSYRHSNCLDQFRKAFANSSASEVNPEDCVPPAKFVCPLCRGAVGGWTVVESARRYMNAKARSCSMESCAFSGTYSDLRKHARMEHPSVRPTEANPERERDWMRMEQQRDLGDLLSSIQSAVGMEGREAGLGEDEEFEENLLPTARITLYIIQFLGTEGPSVLRYFSRSTPGVPSTGLRRSRRRRSLWGETYDEEVGLAARGSSTTDIFESDDVDRSSEVEVAIAAQQHRQRTVRRRMRLPDEDDFLGDGL